jgi:proton-coupled amino acid transporter
MSLDDLHVETTAVSCDAETIPDLEHGLMRDDAEAEVQCMDVMNEDEETQEDGGIAHRKTIPDTPLYLSAFHVFKGNVGLGVFLLPLVYNDMGYAISPVAGVLVGAMIVDCMQLLLASKTAINRSSVATYAEVVGFTFGSLMRIVVNVTLVLAQFSFCLMYMQGSATIFSEIAQFEGSYKTFVAVQLFFVMPFTFMTHNLKLLAGASATASVLVWFAVIGTVVNFITQLNGSGTTSETITATGTVSKWPLFICSNVTVLEGIGVILPVENATGKRDKPRLALMVKITMTCIIVLYFFYGMFGFLAYGCTLTNTSVTALPTTAFGNIVRCSLAFNLLLTYPIQFVPAIQILDKAMGVTADRTGGKSKKATLVRVGINVFLMMLAMLIGGDTLALVLAFIGATAAVFLAAVLPALLGLHTQYAIDNAEVPREGKAYYKAMLTLQPNPVHRVKCFAYLGIGIAIFAIGTATCLIDTAAVINRKTHRNGHGGAAGNSTTTTCDL